MSEDHLRYPKLEKYYQLYLIDECSASFIQSVSREYAMATLERLATFGSRISRRAAMLAMGFLGDFGCNEVMGQSLNDHDRGVRLLADHGIRQIWARQGTSSHQQSLLKIYRLNSQQRLEEAIDSSTSLLNMNPKIGEAWNQRAIAYCAQGEFDAAIADCRETLNCNRYHFPAAMGMAHCCLQLDNAQMALDCFKLALRINPDLEGVRNHITHLERIIE